MNRSFVWCCVVWVWTTSPLRAGGEWFTLTDFNGHWRSRADDNHPLAKALAKHVEDNQEFKCVAFTPEGDWVLLSGTNDVWTSNESLPAVKKLLELRGAGHKFNCVAFTPTNGWVVLCDRMNPLSSNIPNGALKQMEELVKNGSTLRSITFLPNGEWVLLVDEIGVFYSGGVPADLRKVLDGALKRRIAIRCVASTTFGDWFVITSKEYWASDPNHPAAKQLATSKNARQSLKWVTVAPEDPATTRLRLDVTPAQHVKAVLKCDAFVDGKVEEFLIYAPEVPSVPGQKDIRTMFSPKGQIVHEDGPQQRPLIQTKISDGRQEIRTALTIEATLMSRRLRPLFAGEKGVPVPDLSPEEVKLFTLSSTMGQPNPAVFREWMERVGLKRKDGESDQMLGYRVLRYIKHHFRYESPTGDQSASAVCGAGKSDCMGLSNLFTWVMRDNGVPARKLIGRFADSGKMHDLKSAKPGSEGKEHVKAEFFIRGVGWVPVDTAAAVASPNASDFAFIGDDPGNFITLSHDPLGTTDTFLTGKLHGIAAQGISFDWRVSDKARNVRFEITWTVTK